MEIEEIVATIASLLFVAIIFYGISVMTTVASCNNYHAATGLPTKRQGLTCYANTKGQWFPINKIVSVSEAVK